MVGNQGSAFVGREVEEGRRERFEEGVDAPEMGRSEGGFFFGVLGGGG